MADIITTLHPEGDTGTNLYPNIKKENIPDGSIDYGKLDSEVANDIHELQIDIENIGDGSPHYVGTASQITALTSNQGIAVATDTGYWYYWNGTQYVSSGKLYQSTGIADGSITKVKLGTDLLKNILDENKLKDTIIINEENVTTKVGIYINIHDYRASYTEYKCVLLDVSNCDSIEFTSREASGVAILMYEKVDGTIGEISNQTTGYKHLDLKDVVKIAINFFGSSFYSDFKIIKNSALLKLDDKYIITPYNIATQPGIYVTIDNMVSSANEHRCSYKYKCKGLKSVTFKGQDYNLNQVVWKDREGNTHGSSNTGTDIIRCDVSDAVEIAFNFFDISDEGVEMFYQLEFTDETLNAYENYNNKGLVFDNTKSALFVGDSITAGYTSGGTTTPNTFPKLFSELYNMTYYNEAVAGTEYCEDGVGLPRMLTQITNSTHKSVDYLFICGGTNDWQSQNNLTTFRQAVKDTIDYAIANYPNAQIILVTPINACFSYANNEKVNSLQVYRNIITEVAMMKNSDRITIVQGNKFNFPNPTNNSVFVSDMFGDGLHPSEKGYATAYLYGLIDNLK